MSYPAVRLARYIKKHDAFWTVFASAAFAHFVVAAVFCLVVHCFQGHWDAECY